ncbi:hypothetical protein D3C83_80200 [compost metagenome]
MNMDHPQALLPFDDIRKRGIVAPGKNVDFVPHRMNMTRDVGDIDVLPAAVIATGSREWRGVVADDCDPSCHSRSCVSR